LFKEENSDLNKAVLEKSSLDISNNEFRCYSSSSKDSNLDFLEMMEEFKSDKKVLN